MDKQFTVRSDTYATNQGQIILNPIVWFENNIPEVVILSTSLILSICSLVFIGKGFGFLALLLIFVNVFYWKRKKEHFRYGDTNGGVIVSVNPNLLAVKTDLSSGFGNYPVFKIIPYKKKCRIGDRIVTVSLYTSSSKEDCPYWVDFDPIPITYATKNPKEIELALSRIEEEQWFNLETSLGQIQRPYKEGLYRIEDGTSNW